MRIVGKRRWLRVLLLAGGLAVMGLAFRGPVGWGQTASDPESSPGPLRPVAPVQFAQAMVVAANPLASQAGAEILRAGGNAVDAAVATAYALNVVEPQSSGIGGGLFMLVYLAQTGEVVSIDGREEAPSSATPRLFLRPDGSAQPFFPDRITGGRPVGVPGAVRALEKARARYGTLPLATVMAPALRLATEGFVVSERMAGQLALHRKRLAGFPSTRGVFFPDGVNPLRAGERLRQPDLARTFRLLAEQGDTVFYEGEIARDILRVVNEAAVNPGRMTAGDLASYQAPLRAPVAGAFRGFTVYGMGPPSSGGIAVQQMLALLEHWPTGTPGLPPALAIHRFAQATRLAFADRDAYAADGDFVPVPVRGLLDAAYLRERAASVPWRLPLSAVQAGAPPGAPTAQWGRGEDTEHWSTTHLAVVDAQRNVVSLTATIEQGFGSGLVVPGRGFLLNNELTDFSARPEDALGQPVANRVEGARRPRAGALDIPSSVGGKRPRSSMAPTIVLRDGRPVLALGSPGGARIIPYVAGVLEAVLVDGREDGAALQDAINRPHATHLGGTTVLEPELDAAALGAALQPLGHGIAVSRQASGLHGIWIDPMSGRLHAGIDPRREGAANGY
jgi:gamma-glutamyltranspeptidase/glutathione hydrolase